jgi:hypothetical protein
MWRGTVEDQIWVVRGLAMFGVVGLEDGGGRWDGMDGCLEARLAFGEAEMGGFVCSLEVVW